MSERIIGVRGEARDAETGKVVASNLRYELDVTHPQPGQLGRISASIELDHAVGAAAQRAGKMLTLQLDDGREVDFWVTTVGVSHVGVTATGGLRASTSP